MRRAQIGDLPREFSSAARTSPSVAAVSARLLEAPLNACWAATKSLVKTRLTCRKSSRLAVAVVS